MYHRWSKMLSFDSRIVIWMWNQDSSIGIATGYGLDDRMNGIRFPAGPGNISLRHHVQTGSGTHPASYPMGNRGSFRGGEMGAAWKWPLISIWCRGQRMRGAVLPLLQYVIMAWCLVKHREDFTLLYFTFILIWCRQFTFPFVVLTTFVKTWFTLETLSSLHLGDVWTLCYVLDEMWSCNKIVIFLVYSIILVNGVSRRN
jgi:hypothetical protein